MLFSWPQRWLELVHGKSNVIELLQYVKTGLFKKVAIIVAIILAVASTVCNVVRQVDNSNPVFNVTTFLCWLYLWDWFRRS